MTRQIAVSQIIVVIARIYAAHRDWIDYEIIEAQRMGKTILGVIPWAQERVPDRVQNTLHRMVRWNSASVINAVRELV